MAYESNASDVGARYARALFDLAVETDALSAVEADLESLKAMRRASADLRRVQDSPLFSADDQARAMDALADRARFSVTTRKFLGVLSANHRLRALSAITAAFERLAADRRKVVFAEVVTAVAMTGAQSKNLEHALRSALGRDPRIEARVDPAILGGLTVKVGSRLYDASLKSKLDSLKFALKRA
ncbi:MAG TPA: F0F1 ATP synthase subunit delta [Caulobacteraceae bacterium]